MAQSLVRTLSLGLAIASIGMWGPLGGLQPSRAPVLAHGETRATFARGGAQLLGSSPVGVEVVGVGRASPRALDRRARAAVAAGEVRYLRAPGVTEWWRRSAAGLEHGVTLDARPAGVGPLRVHVEVEGAVARTTGERDAVFEDREGHVLASYTGLYAVDSRGASLPARMLASATGLVLEVDDAGASYPLVVDPIVVTEEAVLTGAGLEDADAAGTSVALSADGSRAIVGAPYGGDASTPDSGNARVFVRSGTAWSEEARFALTGSDFDEIGMAVALSGDGSIALVGAPGAGANGTAFVVTRTGSTWTRTATLVPSGAAGAGRFGAAVALSSDGTRAIVGGPSGGSNAAAFIFLRAGTSWSQEARLTGGCTVTCGSLGQSVALSADGSRAIAGAGTDTTQGEAVVFARSGTTWAVEATLRAPAGVDADALGASVALTALGDRAVVGAPTADVGVFPTAVTNAGRTFVFTRTGTAWANEASLELGPADRAAFDRFGQSVAVTGDGRRLVAGVPNDDAIAASAGSVRVYLRGATGTWSPEAVVLPPSTRINDLLGSAVALSSDGFRLLAGSPTASEAAGVTGSAVVLRLAHLAVGAACAAATECFDGFCTDGVCCTSACAGGPSDCQACAVAAGAAADGTCGALSVAFAPTVTCRPAVGACDVDDVCVGGVSMCPGDARRAPGSVCRSASGGCDVAEVCDGTSAACPGDGFTSTGSVCRAPVDLCDVEERCPGGSGACPADAFSAAGTLCRTTLAGPCDVADACDGTSAACIDRFQPAGAMCDGTMSDVCDAPDTCDGTAAACPELFLSGVECRGAAGTCDVAEVCSGTSVSCPPDALLAAGVVCRASTDASCDPQESCDGAASSCPADISSCVGIDAGILDGGGSDAGTADAGTADAGTADAASGPDVGARDGSTVGSDAGAPPLAVAGCACRVRSATRGWAGLIGVLVLGALAYRRQRASRPRRR